MGEEYFTLDDAEKISEDDLTFPRSMSLVSAIKVHRDYSLAGLFRRRTSSGDTQYEFLIVDVSCEGVPPKNSVGIQYTERLSLCVSESNMSPIEVLALRKGFPLLMHQNSTLPGEPPSLCLYQEPPRSIARAWTAPSFLKRIQYWLEQSAHGTLHAEDQPVEQLFFTSLFELVLPWNFSALLSVQDTRFWISKAADRPENGLTLFLESRAKSKSQQSASVVILTLPAVKHGRVESDFGTLGQLADTLESKGINLLNEMTGEVQRRVGMGTEVGKDDQQTVLLMHIPITRGTGEEPERVIHKAYLIKAGILKLGASMGAVFEMNGIYHKITSFGTSLGNAEWREQAVFPMEVLQCIDRETARRQSGVASEGPTGVLVGSGAIGSTLLDMWTRSGWGEWTVIDNDHIKPHNLVRHQAGALLIGKSKAQVAEQYINWVMQGAAAGKGVHADACDFTNDKVLGPLQTSNLIVDASTTLDYPRLVSSREDVCRHASVFVTPNGLAGVLLLEDADRKKRLRTLEAQYYRAILSEEWGRNHLDGNLGNFWSGASCRDISFVLPYSEILGHTATFVDQLQHLSEDAEAAIRVWVRDKSSGAVSAYSIKVYEETCQPVIGLDMFIDNGVLDKLATLRHKQLPAETGGILLGYYDFNIKAVVIVDALPAPRDSKGTAGSFERGIEGVKESVIEANRRTAGIVGYVGEWHSHPDGYGTLPSGADKYLLMYLSIGMAEEGLPAVMLIVGDGEYRALQGVAR